MHALKATKKPQAEQPNDGVPRGYRFNERKGQYESNGCRCGWTGYQWTGKDCMLHRNHDRGPLE